MIQNIENIKLANNIHVGEVNFIINWFIILQKKGLTMDGLRLFCGILICLIAFISVLILLYNDQAIKHDRFLTCVEVICKQYYSLSFGDQEIQKLHKNTFDIITYITEICYVQIPQKQIRSFYTTDLRSFIELVKSKYNDELSDEDKKVIKSKLSLIKNKAYLYKEMYLEGIWM